MPAGAEFYAALMALHERMLAGDPTLLGEVARLIYEPLMAQLHREFRKVNDHLLHEGAVDALMEYAKDPSQANAKTGAGVMGFLMLRSKSRVIDGIRRERRQDEADGGYAHGLDPSAERDRGNVVELRRARAEHVTNEMSNAISVPPPDIEERLEREALVEAVLAGAESDLDRRLLEMMFAGIRETAEYARALGIDGEPVELQEETVKRHKDRLLAAAKRREAAKHSGVKRRGRPPRRRGDEGGNHG